jgi:outer membrane receptor protein involved in Fe transport
VNDSLSQYLVSPDIEIIAMSTPKFGVLLKASREYLPINYTEICEKNPFISSKTNFVPMKKEMELKLGIEYKFSSQLSLNGEIIRQSWKKYAYWYREPKIGLFQLNSLNKATLTILNFQSKFTFSSKLNVDAGIQINFDSSKDDSVTNHLPYLERFRIPFNLEYKIDKTTQASLTIQLIGPRYADLKNNEKLSSIGLLSVYLEKQLIKNISVFVEGNNLTNQKYEIWQKYPSMGFYFGAGLRGSW